MSIIGFFDNLNASLAERRDKVNNLRERYSNYSTSQLAKIIRSKTNESFGTMSEEANAAMFELRDRGFSSEDINELVHNS